MRRWAVVGVQATLNETINEKDLCPAVRCRRDRHDAGRLAARYCGIPAVAIRAGRALSGTVRRPWQLCLLQRPSRRPPLPPRLAAIQWLLVPPCRVHRCRHRRCYYGWDDARPLTIGSLLRLEAEAGQA